MFAYTIANTTEVTIDSDSGILLSFLGEGVRGTTVNHYTRVEVAELATALSSVLSDPAADTSDWNNYDHELGDVSMMDSNIVIDFDASAERGIFQEPGGAIRYSRNEARELLAALRAT